MLLDDFFINFATERTKKHKTMTKKKKAPKAKEPIRLRYKKLANGNTSLYLDCYRNGQRTYEFLRLYLVPEKDITDTIANKNTLEAAMAIKAERTKEVINGEAGLTKSTTKGKILLTDWMEEVIRRKEGQKDAATKYKNTNRYIKATKGGTKIMLKDVNADFCLRFLETLKTTKAHKITKGKEVELKYGLSENTQSLYTTAFSACLNEAVLAGIISKNPMNKVSAEEKPHMRESKREFLLADELARMAAAPCKNEQVKRAFIFSCLTGLRISDIRRLTWGKIQGQKGKLFIYTKMEKTQDTVMVPLTETALQWLPARGKAKETDPVFTLPTNTMTICKNLTRWAQAAGVKKKVTFHVSRHTFATLELTMGADLYTVSKLLGHKKVSTTQIYAKIIDEKKQEAVDLLDGIIGAPATTEEPAAPQHPGTTKSESRTTTNKDNRKEDKA